MKGKAIILAGGSGGLGGAVAEAIAKRGGVPVIGYLSNRARADNLAKDGWGGMVAGFPAPSQSREGNFLGNLANEYAEIGMTDKARSTMGSGTGRGTGGRQSAARRKHLVQPRIAAAGAGKFRRRP